VRNFTLEEQLWIRELAEMITPLPLLNERHWVLELPGANVLFAPNEDGMRVAIGGSAPGPALTSFDCKATAVELQRAFELVSARLRILFAGDDTN
jgi:hypothetical protein